jgi:DNA replication protein DnaC
VPEPCKLCHGTGLEVVPGKGARRCECRKADPAKLFAAAQVPEIYRDCTLKSYRPQPGQGSQLKAYSYAFRLVQDFPCVERGLLLMGPVGVGKTHLCVSVLRGLAEKGAQVLFRDFPTLLKEIQSTYNKRSELAELDILRPIYEAQVLLLDELGARSPSEWERAIIGTIIGERYNHKRLTLATTNCLDVRRSPSEKTLGDRIGAPARSRLKQMCKTLHVEGEDYRDRFDGDKI